MRSVYRIIPFIILVSLLLAACGQATNTAPAPIPTVSAPLATNQPTPAPGPTPTNLPPAPTASALPPTPPPAPLAAKVNGAGLTLAEYKAELQRLQLGLKETGKQMSAEEQQKAVLQDQTDQLLLAQAAEQGGYILSDAEYQKRLTDLTASAGGTLAFADWLTRNFYTSDSFQQALRRSLAAAWQRDQILAKAPNSAEQVHARQILVLNEDLANRLYAQLKAGTNFETLAIQMDPESGGELGWFPRGYLFLPEIEAAAFELAAGKYSAILKTSYGYHIVYVIERDSNRPLAPDARLQTQRLYLRTWLTEQRAKSRVEILIQ